MTGEEIDEAEADAEQLQRMAGAFAEEGIRTRELARRLEVEIVRAFGIRLAMRREAELSRIRGRWTIHLFQKMTPEREAWIIGHELGHYLFRVRGSRPANEERRADAIGAALVAPRALFGAAAKRIGHRVHLLAQMFETTQSLALLRIGEVTGRPVLLLRSEPVARGAPFEWSDAPLSLPRSLAHPIKVDGGLGMMADRWAA